MSPPPPRAQALKRCVGHRWFLANDDRVPTAIRADISAFGLCGDEFEGTGNWPPELYVREARRMVGGQVFTEHDRLRGIGWAPDVIGLGSFWFDSVRATWGTAIQIAHYSRAVHRQARSG